MTANLVSNVSTSVKESNPVDLTAFDQVLEYLRQNSDSLRQAYTTAKPYPHLVLDDLFPPELLDRLIADFPQAGDRDWLTWDTSNELKTTSKGIQGLSTFSQIFCLWLNSVDVVRTIESIVGLEYLVGDPTFHGAGLHEMRRDGWLDMHADYTRHFSLPLMRRINILIYLNRDWDPSWGGELAMQDATNESTRISYPCHFNRTIIFPTTAKTFHGAPTHITCPPDRSRKLLSVYYWSPIPMPLWSKMGTPLLWAQDNKRKLKRILKKA